MKTLREKIGSIFVYLILAAAMGLPVWASYVIPDGSVTTAKLASQAVSQAKMSPRPTGSIVPAGGVAISASSANFTTTSSSFTAATNLSVTITTLGRPVMLMLIPDPAAPGAGGNEAWIGTGAASEAQFQFYRGASGLGAQGFDIIGSSGFVPCSAAQTLDPIAAGTYTYTLKARNSSAQSTGVNYCMLMAYEL